MKKEEQQFIEALTQHLRKLPDVKTRKERHESWMTAEEMVDWWSQEHGEDRNHETIDSMLRSWWSIDRQSRTIRPAKYPDRNTACRLWGHVE